MSKFYQAHLTAQMKDPGAAAILSIVPGLGHIYEGQKRKGFLFLAVSAINVLTFLIIAFNDQMVAQLIQAGSTYHIQPNEQLIKVLKQVSFGSITSIMFAGLVLSFLAYAVQDAYDHASFLKRRRIYSEQIMEMPEATSSSYIIHFAMIASCFILAMFFLVPPKPKQQVTDIMFIQTTPIKKHIRQPKTKINATNSSTASGKHNPSKEIAQSRTPPKAKPNLPALHIPARYNPATPTSRNESSLPLPAPAPAQQSANKSNPTVTPSQRSYTSISAPMPLARGNAGFATSLPQASPITLAQGSDNSGPTFAKSSSATGNSHMPGTQPIASVNNLASGHGLQPMPKASTTFGTGGQMATPPTPIRASNTAGSGTQFVPITPSLPRPGTSLGTPSEGNSDAHHTGERTDPGATHNANFGPYMDDLQRRIKRCWFPPKDLSTKRVVVNFKIYTDGSVSHLRIEKSSGSAIADQAALKAVESAQPFRHLPQYAPSDVDIQFTFDYNVFGGQRR